MTCITAVVVYGRGILQVLFESFFKGPGDFPYVFIITGKGHHIGTNIWPHFCWPWDFCPRGHKMILEQHGTEVLWLFKDWERFQMRDFNYRNHRIFTLICITNHLVPVSIRLKTTIKREKDRNISRKAGGDLLQARVKSINSILGDNAKQRELCRSQLASIFSSTTMNKCQQLIDNVTELRFLKS